VVPVPEALHVAVGVIGGENLDRINRIYRIGDQGVLVEAVGGVGVGDGVDAESGDEAAPDRTRPRASRFAV
jgi:hypothetical protein